MRNLINNKNFVTLSIIEIILMIILVFWLPISIFFNWFSFSNPFFVFNLLFVIFFYLIIPIGMLVFFISLRKSYKTIKINSDKIEFIGSFPNIFKRKTIKLFDIRKISYIKDKNDIKSNNIKFHKVLFILKNGNTYNYHLANDQIYEFIIKNANLNNDK
jgi:hypothetical protein